MAAAADLFPRVPTSPASFPLSSPPSFQASFFLLFLRPVVSAQVGRLPASAREPALRAEVRQQQASVLGGLNSRVEAGRERSAGHCRTRQAPGARRRWFVLALVQPRQRRRPQAPPQSQRARQAPVLQPASHASQFPRRRFRTWPSPSPFCRGVSLSAGCHLSPGKKPLIVSADSFFWRGYRPAGVPIWR